MLSSLPRAADLYQLAAAGKSYTGRIDPSEFQRLFSAVHRAGRRVEISLRFGVEEGVHYLRGELDTELVVLCQRCMAPLDLPLGSRFLLGLVRSAGEEPLLPDRFEPFLVEQREMDLHALVEDELLLSLPLVPRHPAGECLQPPYGGGGREAGSGRQRPFAVLAGLAARGEKQ